MSFKLNLPEDEQPLPVYSQQQPVYSQQQPAYSQQQPAYSQQQPAYSQQQPAYSQQQPDEFLEQELPADFAALGEQLSADAQRLSSVYPACQPPLELIAALGGESQRPSLARQILALASAAAGILLMLGLIGFALSPVWIAQPPEVPPVGNPPAKLVNAPAVASPLPGAIPALQPVSYRPALVDVNGPELEGLLDLWHEQPQAESSISF